MTELPPGQAPGQPPAADLGPEPRAEVIPLRGGTDTAPEPGHFIWATGVERPRVPYRPPIGTPVHIVAYGNPSGAPCLPGVFLGVDANGTDWVGHVLGTSGVVPARFALPEGEQGPRWLLGTWHRALSCTQVDPVSLTDIHIPPED